MADEYFDHRSRRCSYCDLTSVVDGTRNLMKCSGCLITYYCNRDHQVADWKKHKQLCKELQAKRSSNSSIEDELAKNTPITNGNGGKSQMLSTVSGPLIVRLKQSWNNRGDGSDQMRYPGDQGIDIDRSGTMKRPADQVLDVPRIVNRSVDQIYQMESRNRLPPDQVYGIESRDRFPMLSSHQLVERSIPSGNQSIDRSRMALPIDDRFSASINQHPALSIHLSNQSMRSPDFDLLKKSNPTSLHNQQPSTDRSAIKSILTGSESDIRSAPNRSTSNSFVKKSISFAAMPQSNEPIMRHSASQSALNPPILDRSEESIDKSINAIKREDRVPGCQGGKKLAKRASVIQLASTQSSPGPPEKCPKRSRSDRSPSQQRGPKKSKRSASSMDCSAGPSGKSMDEYGPKKDHSLNYPLDLDRDNRYQQIDTSMSNNQDILGSRMTKMAQFVAASLREYGWAVVDKFLGDKHCRAVLKEMQILQERGEFSEGRLLKSKHGTQLHGVRSDTILFLTNGSDDGIHVGLLVALIDSLIFQLAGSIPPYNVCGRTRPMLTCYPGQRSRYITHVDNPDKDGRCVTATYYLNEDWRPAHGGLLRLYPVSAFKSVDVEPIFDRLVLYWSDRRNPHEILPSYRKRFSINVWYYDNEEKTAADSRQMHCDSISPSQKSCC